MASQLPGTPASAITSIPVTISQGGTSNTTASAAFAALITGTTISLAQGGTGQTSAVASLDALHGTIATIASATTTDLSTATGEYSIISGNVTITGFGTVSAGSARIVRFSGTPIITHNASSLILPGGANITAASGDVMFISSLGSGNWRCTSYLRGGAVPYNADASALTTGALAIANGGTANTTANAALNALQALTLSQTSTLALNDNLTNTAPIVKVLSHVTSGTAAAGFGYGVGVSLQSASGNLRSVMTDVTTLTTATDAAEVASRVFNVMSAGALVATMGLGFVAGNTCLFLGPISDNTYTRRISANTVDYLVGGTQILTHSNGQKRIINLVRLGTARGASISSATTITLGTDGNVFPITGTTTVKGIVTSSWGSGDKIVLELASGITINHNDASPGSGAVAIQLRLGANLITAAVYFLELIYNGTFWYQPG